MNKEDQIAALLQEHNFDLVRQRKHKIYRNPDGLIFVAASTPSDRRAPQNALAMLKRILRQQVPTCEPETSVAPAPAEQLHTGAASESVQPPLLLEMAEASLTPLSDGEWENWKRQYWRDEKLRAKNEVFLSVLSRYLGRVSQLMHSREDVASVPAADAVKGLLRASGYKSKVLFYTFKGYAQGILVHEAPNQPIVWTSNGHIGASAFVYFDDYVQHGASRPEVLRFDWDGIPVHFERPEKAARKLHSGQPIK